MKCTKCAFFRKWLTIVIFNLITNKLLLRPELQSWYLLKNYEWCYRQPVWSLKHVLYGFPLYSNSAWFPFRHISLFTYLCAYFADLANGIFVFLYSFHVVIYTSIHEPLWLGDSYWLSWVQVGYQFGDSNFAIEFSFGTENWRKFGWLSVFLSIDWICQID